MGTPTNRTPVRVARGTYSNLNTNKADIQGSEIVYATDENKLYVKEGTDLIDANSVDISGKQDLDADLTALSSCQTGAATALALLTSTEVEVLDGVTAGTAEASKAVVLDASKDITGLNDITITGDLTGNVTGNVTGNASGTAATVTGAAQTNITSVGTLTAIDIDGPYTQTKETITQSATPTVDLSTGNYFTLTQNANVTSWTFSNPPASGEIFSFVIELANVTYTTTWTLASGTVKWPADTAPTLAASKTHLIIFTTDDEGTTYRASSIADYTT